MKTIAALCFIGPGKGVLLGNTHHLESGPFLLRETQLHNEESNVAIINLAIT